MMHVVAEAGTLDVTVLTTGHSAVVRMVGHLDAATSRLLQAVLDHFCIAPAVRRSTGS